MNITKPQPAPSKTELRWFHPTPGRLLVVLLSVEGILLLCDWFRWMPKGWAVLMAIVAVAVTIVLMFLWFAVALVCRWRFQFSIAWLLLFSTTCAIPFSWLAVKMQMARKQKEAVESLLKLGGIAYNYEDTDGIKAVQPYTSAWLRNVFGDDLFRNVALVSLNAKTTNADLQRLKELNEIRVLCLETPQVTDAGLEYLRGLKQLQRLVIMDAAITDAGLEHLKGLNELKRLIILRKSQFTDAGIAKLQKALPNCKIER